MNSLRRFVIAGCNGHFGRIFGRKLAAEGCRVAGISRREVCSEPAVFREYKQGVITQPSDEIQRLLSHADGVLLCVPEPAVLEAIPVISKLVDDDALVIDIASVKSRIARAVEQSQHRIGYLSIHPMFGPVDDFEARNVAVVPLNENERTDGFINLLTKWRANVTRVTAEEHDRTTAYVQAASHAAILSFAGAIARSGISYESFRNLSTPVQRTLLVLAARIASGDGDLYWNIQSDNPFAHDARELLKTELTKLAVTIDDDNSDEFSRLIDEVAKMLEPDKERLLEIAANLVDTVKMDGT